MSVLPAIGAVAAGGLQFIPGINDRERRRDTQQSKELTTHSANLQYGLDKKFWDYTFDKSNEYNTPQAQMTRLTAAGLNPNLIYGSNAGGASGNTSSSASTGNHRASGKSSGIGSPPSLDISGFLQVANQKDMVKNDTARVGNETNLAGAEVSLKIAQAKESISRSGLTEAQKRVEYAKLDRYLATGSFEATGSSVQVAGKLGMYTPRTANEDFNARFGTKPSPYNYTDVIDARTFRDFLESLPDGTTYEEALKKWNSRKGGK